MATQKYKATDWFSLLLEAKKFAAVKYHLKTFQSAYLQQGPKERMPRQLHWGISSHYQENNIGIINAKKTTAYYKYDEFFRVYWIQQKTNIAQQFIL